VSNDEKNWSNLGTATRAPGGWMLPGISVPAGAHVRARGLASPNGFCSWFVESIFSKTQPVIFTRDGSFGLRTNQFGFRFGGSVGQSVVVQGSTNLSDFIGLATNVLGNAPVYFSDPQTRAYPFRSYQLWVP
jgi:hypothetical protein